MQIKNATLPKKYKKKCNLLIGFSLYIGEGGVLMKDTKIIDLYFARDENAIQETASVYGQKLDRLSFRITKNVEDAGECVNDTYLKAWNTMPPQKPTYLFAYLAKICRYLCFGKLDYQRAKKRNFDIVTLSDELSACIPDKFASLQQEQQVIGDILTTFLKNLSDNNRLIFMRRYWFSDSISEISQRYDITQSKVKTSLFRTRGKLKSYLERQGISI